MDVVPLDFPHDPWRVVTGGGDVAGCLIRLKREISHWFAAPRDPGLVCAFLRQHLKPGRVLIHGAGTHTDAIFDAVNDSSADMVGLIDRRAAELKTYRGLPVVSPSQAAALEFDYVLLSHTCRERDMARELENQGCDPERIVSIYEHPDYIKISLEALRVRLRPEKATPCPFVIIRAGRSQIIEDVLLADAFPPEQTASFFLGRHDYKEQSSVYQMVDLKQSVTLLGEYLAAVQPRVVFLSTGWFNNFLFPVIRDMLPGATLVHEIFDWHILLSGLMSGLIGHSERTVAFNCLGEYDSAQRADLVISKRDGNLWHKVQRGFKSPYKCFFPGAREPEPLLGLKPQVHLIYGGILPLPDFLQAHIFDYNFLNLFENLAQDSRFRVEIFNSLHESPRDDGLFQGYEERFQDTPLSYHPRQSYDRFLQRVAGADYGWLATVDRQQFHLDQVCVVPHRAVGYLAAGIPVLVDEGWLHLADLVRRYEAGLVLDDFEPEALKRTLLNADRKRHRQGARRLAAALVEHNQGVLAGVARLTA